MEEMKAKKLNVKQLMVAIFNISLKIEAVENLLKEKDKMPYDLEGITVTTSEENDSEKTMGDLHRQRLGLQQELQDRLMTHKMEPYIGSDHEDLIAKVAAAMLNNTDIIEDRLRGEFEDEIDSLIKRYGELNMFFVKQKPRKLVINRLKEALECYVHGFFQGCAILCRSTLETAIKEKMKEKLGKEPDKTLGKLLVEAKKLGIISKDDDLFTDRVKAIGDDTVHDSSRCSSAEAYESLAKTKFLLNRLYQIDAK